MTSGTGKNKSNRATKTVRAASKGRRTSARPAGSQSRRRKDSALDAVLSLYRSKKYGQITDRYARFDYSAILDPGQRREFLTILAFSQAMTGQLPDAEATALKGLELNGEDADLFYILAYTYTGLKNYNKIIEYCRKFINATEKTVAKARLCRGLDNYIYNYLGLAQAAKNDSDAAHDSFIKSIELDPTMEHAYLNLAGLLNSINKRDEALKWINKGLKKCRQVQELRLMKTTLENRVTISACMIVKDEEELLPGCLRSIRDWVDEIIVVDTGSTDRTVEIAREYGAKVYFQKWANDFSAPRNLSLQKATCDWILIIDADEEFVGADVNVLRTVLTRTDSRMLSINVENVNPRTGETSSGLISIRLFRNSPDFYYEGIVHNQLKYPPDLVALPVPITIKHYGYNLAPEKMRQKLMRSRRLLEKQLEKQPDFAFAHFNMAQLLRSMSEDDEPDINDKVIYHAERVIALTDKSLGIHLQAHHQAAFAALKKKDLDTAEKFLKAALKLKSDYLDAIFTYGQVYIARRDYEKAQRYLLEYLDLQHKYYGQVRTDNMIQMYIRARHIAYYYLGLVQYEQGNKEKAADYLSKVLTEQEPYRDTYIRLAGIYLEMNESDRALPYIEKELDLNPESDLAHLYQGGALMFQNRADEAEPYFLRALELTHNRVDVCKRAGCFLAGRKKYTDAIAAFSRWTEVEPNNPEPWQLKAKAAYEAENYDTAIESYRQCLTLDPQNMEIINDLANCYYKINDFGSAEIEYSKALEKETNLAVTYRNLGLTKIKLGKTKEALTLLTQYLSAAPDDFAVERAVADLYIGTGDFASALQHFEQILRNNPVDVDALFSISECYYKLGHVQSAQIGYRQVLKIDPSHRGARERIARLSASIKTS